ncbi:MAG: hypothetical protein R2801_06860 [Chitinophagales bacterium]
MKKIIFILLVLVTMISCKKENSNSNILEGKVNYLIIQDNYGTDTLYFYYDSTDLWLEKIIFKNNGLAVLIDKPINDYIKISYEDTSGIYNSFTKFILQNNKIVKESYVDEFLNEAEQCKFYTTNFYLDSLSAENYGNIPSFGNSIIKRALSYTNGNIDSITVEYSIFIPPSSYNYYSLKYIMEYGVHYNNNINVPDINMLYPLFIFNNYDTINVLPFVANPYYFLTINGYQAFKPNNNLTSKITIVNGTGLVEDNIIRFNYLFDNKNRVNKITATNQNSSGSIELVYY